MGDRVRVLACDVGGTHTRFRIGHAADHVFETSIAENLPSASFPSLIDALDAFLARAGRLADGIDAAGFAVAGPIANGRVQVTNLPWRVDRRELAARLRGCPTALINDFQAVGFGIDSVPPAQLLVLQPGKPRAGALRALIGAGTGLGQALMTLDKGRYTVHATEGGHVDFAPRDDVEMALLADLAARHGHVSVERVVSGPGLSYLFSFLCALRGHQPSGELAAALCGDDRAGAIADFALTEKDPVCVEALDRFVSMYGAQAGNLALTCLPRGGLFVAGGIAPKVLPRLSRGRFLAAFLDKGRMRPLLERIPLAVVLDEDAGVRGAALAAWRLAAGEDESIVS